MMERAKLACRVGEWQLAQRAARGRYERGMSKGHGNEARFPDWFDDGMTDWVNQQSGNEYILGVIQQSVFNIKEEVGEEEEQA